MDGVVRVTNNTAGAKNASALNRSRAQRSTTLNRRFVKKPTVNHPQIRAAAGAASRTLKNQKTKQQTLVSKTNKVQLKPLAKQANDEKSVQQRVESRTSAHMVSLKDLAQVKVVDNDPIEPAQDTKVAKVAKARLAARKAPAPQQLSAQELKERAIQQALRRVSTMEDVSDVRTLKKTKHVWQKKKVAVAAVVAVLSLVVLGYLVSVNLPDISVRVAAIHSGIEKSYPSYVPANYRLDGLAKEEQGRITMAFKNDQGQRFSLVEEKSSWDSAAVLTNYVYEKWGDDYSVAKDQGLTIYISGSSAAWVNGGVFYLIIDESDALNSSDLHDIAISL
ncbi:hypothetical protein J6X13_01275 [Candidatus Saccharibacteria bacterium]|nr:hypothetical protein [Candidatus Saccharibacteria bacterium]